MGKIFLSGFMDFSFSFIFMESILPVFSTCNNFFVFHFLFSAGGCESVESMILGVYFVELVRWFIFVGSSKSGRITLKPPTFAIHEISLC
jgi:hypothetical protein